jgi:hypothetical protein
VRSEFPCVVRQGLIRFGRIHPSPSRGWSAARKGRGEAVGGAGGRGRREFRRIRVVDPIETLRRSIHVWLLGDFVPFVCSDPIQESLQVIVLVLPLVWQDRFCAEARLHRVFAIPSSGEQVSANDLGVNVSTSTIHLCSFLSRFFARRGLAMKTLQNLHKLAILRKKRPRGEASPCWVAQMSD